MSLANTTWTYPSESGPSTTVVFGPSENSSGNPGGYGTTTVNYSGAGPVVNDIMWMEDGKGRFMFQVKGSTDHGSLELPTVTGTYTGNIAIGWGSNFNAIWGTWDVAMTKHT